MALGEAGQSCFDRWCGHTALLQVPQVYLDMMSKAGGGPFDNETDTSDKLLERRARRFHLGIGPC